MRDTKKILIVSSSFYPMNSPRSFRTTELVKEFSRQGHEVTLLTMKDEKVHSPFEEEFDVTIKDLGSLQFAPITLNGEQGGWYHLKRIMRRGLHLFFEYPRIELMFKVKKALKFESGYDLLISIAVPHTIHWGVAWGWRKNDTIADIWVADCGDPYMGAVLDSFGKMFYFKYFEKFFCRKANYISVPLEEAKKGYYPEFRNKIRVIPQGFKFDEIIGTHATVSDNAVPTFAYAGGLIPGGRDPRALLEYLASLKQEYKFILFTKSRELVQPYVDKSRGRIEIRDYIPREELLQILSKMDFLVNFENSTALQTPSKLIDYYLTGRPVLSVPSSEVDTTIVNEFLVGDYSNSFTFKNMDQYKIENVCGSFLNLCNTKKIPWKV